MKTIATLFVFAALFIPSQSMRCNEPAVADCVRNAELSMADMIKNRTFDSQFTCCVAHNFLECIKEKSVACPAIAFDKYMSNKIEWDIPCKQYESLSVACVRQPITTV